MPTDLLRIHEIRTIPSRGLTAKTCEFWSYGIGVLNDEPVQIANFHDPDSRAVIAQQIRRKDKSFATRGNFHDVGLYGRWLWRDGGKRVVITTGLVDALSVSQLQDHKWPVVSVPNGDSSAKKAITKDLNWLLKFEEIVLLFDMDESGQRAVKECAPLFPPGRCKVAHLPLKDANDMLKAGRGGEVIDALWGARAYRPDGIVTTRDIRADIGKQPTRDLSWCLPGLDEAFFGRRYGEVVGVGAGTGCGKTTFIQQQLAFDIADKLCGGHKVAAFAFETSPDEFSKYVAGMVAGKTFHVPGTGWTEQQLDEALDIIQDNLFLYDHFGACRWSDVKEYIRFLAHDQGVRIFYIDHLTALAAAEEDERKGLERIMAEIASLAQELSIWILYVSHLSTPEGKPHEEGGRVYIKHFKGSRAIGQWTWDMLAFERDTQVSHDAKPSENLTTLRVLKARKRGRLALGKTWDLQHETATGRFIEVDAAELKARESFSDTTTTSSHGSAKPTHDDF